MLILITGGAASGKSEYAENLCLRLSGNKLYIATMQPHGQEALMRIERHKKLRKEKEFSTLEKYKALYDCEVKGYDTILLECMSTLLANEFFENSNYFDDIVSGINKLTYHSKNVVVITNKIFSDGITYDDATTNYMKALGALNCFLASAADVFIEVICGIPIILKGKEI